MVTLNEVIFDMKELLVLFLTFAKVGVMTFGGGYAMLPILQREVVENKGWATDEELTDYFAIGQCTPGVIAVNTATFIGQKQRGIAGGIVATLGVVFPSLVIISALAGYFDELSTDSFFGCKTWEKGEAAMQRRALERALQKGGLSPEDLDYILAGDLLNQCIGTSFSLREFRVPFYGLYGACSTMGEGLSLASLLIDGGFARLAAAQTSSHYCTAERQYRMPVPYGSQRAPTAQWTATAAGCCILGAQGDGPYITHVTCGKIVDLGISDVNNMGAAMAPAAHDTLAALLRETGTSPGDYDLIVTGDLGALGREIVLDLFAREGIDLSKNYTDCGLLLYDLERQDMHAGGSGCGCSAAVLNGYLLRMMREGCWRRIIFAPTGALLSPTSSFQGESIPGICHAVVFSAAKEGF